MARLVEGRDIGIQVVHIRGQGRRLQEVAEPINE